MAVWTPPVPPLDDIWGQLSQFQDHLNAALSESNARCAESIGITGYEPLSPAEPQKDYFIGEFGLEENLQRAQTYGYTPLPGQDTTPVGDPAHQLSPADAERLGEALDGANVVSVPLYAADGTELGSINHGDGCYRAFYSDYFGDYDTFVRFAELNLRVEFAYAGAIDEDLPADPLYQALVREWQACMHGAGFAVDVENAVDEIGPLGLYGPAATVMSPNGATGEFNWGDDRPSAIERQVAEADVQCKITLSFTDRANTLLARHQQQVIDATNLAPEIAELETIIASAGPVVADLTETTVRAEQAG